MAILEDVAIDEAIVLLGLCHATLQPPCYSLDYTSSGLPRCRLTWGNAENLFALLLRARWLPP